MAQASTTRDTLLVVASMSTSESLHCQQPLSNTSLQFVSEAISDNNSIQSWHDIPANMTHIAPDDDPNLIFRLVAAYGKTTPKIWPHSHNKLGYIPPSFKGFRQSSCIALPDDTEAEIQLTFDKPLKDLSKGFVLDVHAMFIVVPLRMVSLSVKTAMFYYRL